MKKTGVLLINLGTPDSPKVKDVRKYLTEFLNDPRVIDIRPLGRFFLVNGIIVPFRAPKSAKIYKELWEMWDGESPLLTFGVDLKTKLQQKFSKENVTVELAMRYQNPSLNEVLDRMKKEHYEQLIILPLFPHYASASSGSAIEKTLRLIKEWQAIPAIKVIPQFYNDPGFIKTFAKRALEHPIATYDHILFSYHGIPERQLDKQHPELKCADCDCHLKFRPEQPLCYRNTCYETTRLIAAELGLTEDQYTSCFQSRLGKTPWLRPYSDKIIEELVKKGVKKILAFSPAFIADCLETSVEISGEYQEIVEEFGGEKIQLVTSLNDHPEWIDTAERLIRKEMS
ncbi:MAG: ferrochelatase [Crocinitomicaceae bacterium]